MQLPKVNAVNILAHLLQSSFTLLLKRKKKNHSIIFIKIRYAQYKELKQCREAHYKSNKKKLSQIHNPELYVRGFLHIKGYKVTETLRHFEKQDSSGF